MVCPWLLLRAFSPGGGYDRAGCQRQVSYKANLLPGRHFQLTAAPPQASPGFYSPGDGGSCSATCSLWRAGALGPLGSPPGELGSRVRAPTVRWGLLCIASSASRFCPALKPKLHFKLLHGRRAHPKSPNSDHFTSPACVS